MAWYSTASTVHLGITRVHTRRAAHWISELTESWGDEEGVIVREGMCQRVGVRECISTKQRRES